jgi:tetratricopeptide (TPR) repeat protein
MLLACALAACIGGAGASAWAQENKDQAKQDAPKVSGGEQKLAEKLNKAKGAEAKLQAGAEFVKKYPQSPLRPQVADVVAGEINNTQDAALRASLAETYQSIFNAPGEAERVASALLAAYINAGRTEEAMRAGAAWLQKNPDDVDILQNLTILASTEAIKGNMQFAEQGRQYGARAIELFEADKRPASIDAAKWATMKSGSLPTLYRETGVIAFKAGDGRAARTLLEKAAELRSTDPGVYLLLADFARDDYDLRSKEYKVAPTAEKPAALKTAETALDRLIDAYARAVAMTEGNTSYQQANAALRQDLESNYKYRHGGKTDGLQQLIDKYKKQ